MFFFFTKDLLEVYTERRHDCRLTFWKYTHSKFRVLSDRAYNRLQLSDKELLHFKYKFDSSYCFNEDM